MEKLTKMGKFTIKEKLIIKEKLTKMGKFSIEL
jgi:hypothetical protein